MEKARIFIASDHRGFSLKTKLIVWLQAHDFAVEDLGANSEDRCDAGDYAVKLAAEMKKDPTARGVLICGTGQAMAMTANRFRHLRAALCMTSAVARLAREHNDANVLVMGADVIDETTALECLNIFLTTDFLGGRYADRCGKLTDLGGL